MLWLNKLGVLKKFLSTNIFRRRSLVADTIPQATMPKHKSLPHAKNGKTSNCLYEQLLDLQAMISICPAAILSITVRPL